MIHEGRRSIAAGGWTRALLAAALALGGCAAPADDAALGEERGALVVLPPLHLALLADGDVDVGNGTQFLGGDAGSRGAAGKVAFGRATIQSADRFALGHTVSIKPTGSIGTAYTFSAQTLQNKGTVHGSVVGFGGASLPVVPAVAPVTPGADDVLVRANASARLCSGAYRDVEVRRGATLTLDGGVYDVASLDLAREARLIVTAPVVLRVAGDAALARDAAVGLPVGAPAAALRIETVGDVSLGAGASFKGHVLAGGSVDVARDVVFDGVAWAHGDIAVRLAVRFTRDGDLAPTTPVVASSADDGDACTIDACGPGGVVHTPVVIDDGDACTADACAPATGVSHTPVVDGTPCPTGACHAGVCGAAPTIGSPLAAGDHHSLFVRDGIVWATGANAFSQLGDGTSTATSTPVAAIGLADVTSVAAGGDNSMALRADGTVWTWGANQNGQLGIGNAGGSSVPIEVVGLPASPIVRIAAGWRTSFALAADGTLWAWGLNGVGQLCLDDQADRLFPTMVALPAPLPGGPPVRVRAMDGGGSHSLFVLEDGRVFACGDNTVGQLGVVGVARSLSPVEVTGLAPVADVAAGDHHSLALATDGTAWAWGNNFWRQLGDNGVAEQPTPVAVAGGRQFGAIAAGAVFSLAIATDGAVWAWGDDSSGQLGDGPAFLITLEPSLVPGIGGTTVLAAGASHALVLEDAAGVRTVRAWGRNDVGQLGDGTIVERSSPVASSL